MQSVADWPPHGLYSLLMAPRADWTCLSPKCRQDGAATVYEDLPLNTTRCPVCGSKRIQRLYNKIAVLRGAAPARDSRLTSSSHLNRSTALLRSGFDYHDSVKPRYTPPGGGINDPARYDKLRSFDAAAPEVAFVAPFAAAMKASGKGKPLNEMEIMRERRAEPLGMVDTLARLSRTRVPTVPLRSKDETG